MRIIRRQSLNHNEVSMTQCNQRSGSKQCGGVNFLKPIRAHKHFQSRHSINSHTESQYQTHTSQIHLSSRTHTRTQRERRLWLVYESYDKQRKFSWRVVFVQVYQKRQIHVFFFFPKLRIKICNQESLC